MLPLHTYDGLKNRARGIFSINRLLLLFFISMSRARVDWQLVSF